MYIRMSSICVIDSIKQNLKELYSYIYKCYIFLVTDIATSRKGFIRYVM